MEICCTICNSLALFTKATLLSLFILSVADDQLTAVFLRFVPTDGIGKLESGGAEVFEQLPNAGMVVDGQHDFSFAFHH